MTGNGFEVLDTRLRHTGISVLLPEGFESKYSRIILVKYVTNMKQTTIKHVDNHPVTNIVSKQRRICKTVQDLKSKWFFHEGQIGTD